MYRSVALSATLALALAGCNIAGQGSGPGVLEYLLLTPTYDASYVPQVYGTPYDCKIASEKYGSQNVWRGNIGGRIFPFDNQRSVGREGCFSTLAECTAFLNVIEGYLGMVIGRSCVKGYR